MGIAERDYMRRNDEAPQIRWKYGLIIVIGAVLLVAFGMRHCSSAAEKDRHLGKGSLVLNINEATTEELQTLPGVGPARAEHIIRARPYQSIEELFQKGELPKRVVDANRSLLKTTGKNERIAHR